MKIVRRHKSRAYMRWGALAAMGLLLGWIYHSELRIVPTSKTEPFRSDLAGEASASDPSVGDGGSVTRAATTNSELSRDLGLLLRHEPSTYRWSPADLGDLRDRVVRSGSIDSVAALVSYLKSGRDRPLGSRFTVGPGGWLSEAPTVRCWVIDTLTELSLEDALSLTRELFDDRRSPEEWVLAMRILGLPEPDGYAPELEDRFLEMLADESWRRAPSGGFLEGFDVAVFLGTPSASESVAEIMTDPGEHPSVRNAAGIALERVIEASPGLVGDLHDELAASPKTLAYLLATLDVTDPVAAGIVGDYVLETGDPDQELNFFARHFPRHAGSVGYRLLSAMTEGSRTPGRAAEVDLAAAGLVERWMDQAAGEPRRMAVLRQVERRLDVRLESLKRGRAQGASF